MIRFAAWLTVCWALTAMVVPAMACDTYDRKCWGAKRAGVTGGGGQAPLYQRNRSCEDMLVDIHNTSQHALAHLYARDQVFSPTGRGVDYDNPTRGIGYIDHGSVIHIEREIIMIVNLAIRDVRMGRYDGADLGSCEEITNVARSRIGSIQAALP